MADRVARIEALKALPPINGTKKPVGPATAMIGATLMTGVITALNIVVCWGLAQLWALLFGELTGRGTVMIAFAILAGWILGTAFYCWHTLWHWGRGQRA